MKAVYVLTWLVGLGLGTWIAIILINGMRKRIATINRRRAERRNRNGI
jgi:hypothetical protein